MQYLHGTTHTFGNDADAISVVANDGGNVGSGGGADQALGTVNVDITAVNDEENLSTNLGATVAEGSFANTITSSMLQTTDVDNTGAQLVYTIDAIPANGTLRRSGLALANGQTFTQADIDAGLITYDHDGSETSGDSFDFHVDDGAGSSSSGTFNFSVTPTNDSPINSVPTSQVTNEDTPLTFSTANGNAISVADIDAGTNPVIVTLTASNGRLTLGSTANLTFGDGNGVGNRTMTFTGTIADINNALEGLRFTPDADFAGTASIRISTDDNGSFGAGGTLVDVDAINIAVLPINDAPVASGDIFASNNLDGLTVSTPGVLVNDVDVDGDILSVVLISGPSNGTLSLAADGSFTYTPSGTFSGIDSFVYVVTDGTVTSGPATVSIDVTPAGGQNPAPDPEPPETTDQDDNSPEEEDSDDPILEGTDAPNRIQDEVPSQIRRPRQQLVIPNGQPIDKPTEDSVEPEKEAETSSFSRVVSASQNRISPTTFQGVTYRTIPSPTVATFQTTLIFDELDSLIDDLNDHDQFFELVAGTSIIASGAISAGFVVWAARASYFVTMLSSSLPAWAVVDPIPVLDAHALDKIAEKRGTNQSDSSLADLVEKAVGG